MTNKQNEIMNFPTDETSQVLAEMQQAGIDLNATHDVVFFHLFEQESQAHAMVNYIKENMVDVVVSIHPDETPNVWDVDCTVKMVPSYDNVIKKETDFEQIANKFTGYNDGWGIEA